jgi:hypothetical protein
MADMADLAVRPASYRDLKAVSENLVAEIIEGALETHPRPRPRHARAASRLLAELMNKFECGLDRAESWVFIKEPELHLERHVVVPDLAGWRAERLAAEPEDSFIDIAPDGAARSWSEAAHLRRSRRPSVTSGFWSLGTGRWKRSRFPAGNGCF